MQIPPSFKYYLGKAIVIIGFVIFAVLAYLGRCVPPSFECKIARIIQYEPMNPLLFIFLLFFISLVVWRLWHGPFFPKTPLKKNELREALFKELDKEDNKK